ncbi:MAG: ABC transporter substrate-binding protein [Lachnospiraceae bacterium]
MKKRCFLLLSISLFFVSCLTACEKNNKPTEKQGETLTVLNYGKYFDPDALQQFEDETGITIKYEEYESPEEMYTKYKSGSIAYDLICTSDYMIDRLIREGEVKKLDASKLSNYANIDPEVLSLSSSFDPEQCYTIPYFYGTVGILYNKKMVDPSEVQSWDILWNPKYKNEIIQENSVRDAFLPAQKKLGYSLNSTDRKELRNALDLLIEQKPLVYAYMVDETGDEMIAENAALAVLYSGEAAYAMDFNENLDYAVPKEGSNVWIDSWFLPKTCKNETGAHEFLDFLCRDDIAMKNFDYVYYTSPILSVKEEQDEETKQDEVINPSKETLDRCEVYRSLSEKDSSYYSNLWQELKSIQ